jgi:hypothetical protein
MVIDADALSRSDEVTRFSYGRRISTYVLSCHLDRDMSRPQAKPFLTQQAPLSVTKSTAGSVALVF